MTDLPESLAFDPNIPFEQQTLAQLRAERAYWQSKIDVASEWGAVVGVMTEFALGLDRWISRREAEAKLEDELRSIT